jgi:signal transduction histidine kinase/ABC-type amino acid transport substrate-binding protein/ActR/RegA family two-component response regulator
MRLRVLLSTFLFLFILPFSGQAQDQTVPDPEDGLERLPERIITAAVIRDYPPLYSIDHFGYPEGFAIAILSRLKLNARFEVRYYVVENWEEALQAIRSGKADLIPGIGITDKRKQEFLFSKEFETVPISCFIRADNYLIENISNLSGHSVGILIDDAITSQVENWPNANLQSFPNIDMALGRLLSGDLDAFIFPKPILEHKLRLMGISDRVKEAGPPLMERKRGFLFSKENTELFNLINPILSEYVQSKAYVQDYQKWYGKPQPFWTAKRIFLIMSAILALSLATFFIWRYYQINSLNRKMAQTIRDRDTAEKELAKARALLESAIEQTPVGILIADAPSCQIRYINREASRIYDLLPTEDPFPLLDDPENSPWLFFYPDGTPCPLEETPLVRTIFRGETTRDLELVLRRRDASERRILVNASPIRDQKGIITTGIIVFPDITDRVQAEQERMELQNKIQHTQKLESLGVLAGGIAHDFNNLLMAILGNVNMALQEIDNYSPLGEYLEDIEMASQRAADLCRQMLAYSGQGQFVISKINLTSLVREMVHILEVSVSKRALLQYDFAESLPPVCADATQMRQIIMNLIVNASEALGDQNGVIRISTDVMHCDAAYLSQSRIEETLSEGRYVYLEVTDNGCGMDEKVQNRIFEPFFTTKFTGRGLGMAAVLGIVRGHKGALRINSQPGQGSTFRVLFPAVEGPVDFEQPRSKHPSNRKWNETGTILVVDDETSVRNTTRKMLERVGFRVIVAANGLEALELYRQQHEQIRCVVLDLTMPELGGHETFVEMRKISTNAQILLSSGYNEQTVTEGFFNQGLAGFIQKPYTADILLDKLREILEPASRVTPTDSSQTFLLESEHIHS